MEATVKVEEGDFPRVTVSTSPEPQYIRASDDGEKMAYDENAITPLTSLTATLNIKEGHEQTEQPDAEAERHNTTDKEQSPIQPNSTTTHPHIFDQTRFELLKTEAQVLAPDSPAQYAVFATNELLENILVHLPARSIFGVQRVSKLFKDTIAVSRPIQEKVFLRLKSQDGQAPTRWGFRWHIWHEALTPVELSPFLELSPYYLRWPHSAFKMPEANRTLNITLASTLLDTYICDPPCEEAHIDVHYWHPATSQKHAMVLSPEGDEPLTWRKAITLGVKFMGLGAPEKTWEGDLSWTPGSLGHWTPEDRSDKIPAEEAMCRLEREVGSKHGCFLDLTYDFVFRLPNLGLPANEDWQTTGQAPWDRAKQLQEGEPLED